MDKYYKFEGKQKSKSTSRFTGIDMRHPHHHFKSKAGFSTFIINLKDNIPLLATLILVLGGGTQLIILFSIDPKLIRFFSGSQMLVDGLILLTALLSFYILGKIVYYVEANYHLNIYLGITSVLVLFSFYRPASGTYLTSFPTYWSIGAMLFSLFLMYRHGIRFPSYNTGYAKITKKGMVSLNIILYLTGFIYFGGIAYFWYDTIYKIYDVNEISNISNIECHLLDEPYPITHYNILYYNDSYVFIDLWNDKEKTVRVFPVNILLDSAPCK